MRLMLSMLSTVVGGAGVEGVGCETHAVHVVDSGRGGRGWGGGVEGGGV